MKTAIDQCVAQIKLYAATKHTPNHIDAVLEAIAQRNDRKSLYDWSQTPAMLAKYNAAKALLANRKNDYSLRFSYHKPEAVTKCTYWLERAADCRRFAAKKGA